MKRIVAIVLVALLFAVAGCSTAEKEKTEVANPMVEYKTPEEVAEKMKWPMLELPSDIGFALKKLFIISGSIVQFDYADEAGDIEISLRKSKGNEDISGIYGVDYKQESLSGIPVYLGTYEEIRVARFSYEDFSYSVTATGLTGVSFDNLLISVTGAVKAEKTAPSASPSPSTSPSASPSPSASQ